MTTPYANDADLLPYEPRIFTDLPLPGQTTLERTDGVLSGTTLTSAAGGFAALQPNDVIVLTDAEGITTTIAVEAIVDDHTLTLPATPFLAPAEALLILVRTFAPQRRVVARTLHAQLKLTDSDTVLNPDVLVRVEALGALMLAYRAGRSLLNDDPAVVAKADWYHRSFNRARRAALIEIDRNGDGEPDAGHTLGVIDLIRD